MAQPRLTDSEMHTWRLFVQVAARLLDQLDRNLRRHNLTLAEYEILAFLANAPDRRLNMTELADQALVSRSNLTYRIDRLVDRGLVTRQHSEADRRSVCAALTSPGVSLLRAATPDHLADVRQYFTGPSSEHLDTLAEAFTATLRAVGTSSRGSSKATTGPEPRR